MTAQMTYLTKHHRGNIVSMEQHLTGPRAQLLSSSELQSTASQKTSGPALHNPI